MPHSGTNSFENVYDWIIFTANHARRITVISEVKVTLGDELSWTVYRSASQNTREKINRLTSTLSISISVVNVLS